MGRILRCVVAALTALACEAWAQDDVNLQSLFAGLTPVGGGAALTHAEVAQALQRGAGSEARGPLTLKEIR